MTEKQPLSKRKGKHTKTKQNRKTNYLGGKQFLSKLTERKEKDKSLGDRWGKSVERVWERVTFETKTEKTD